MGKEKEKEREMPRRRRRRRRRPPSKELAPRSCVQKDQRKLQLVGSESADYVSCSVAGRCSAVVPALIKTFLRSGQPHGLDVSYCRLVLRIKYNYARFLY